MHGMVSKENQMRRFRNMYYAGAIRRFHTTRAIRDQSVGEHSWGVAVILTKICLPSPVLLTAALYHDMAELHTGDVPSTAKWASKSLKKALDLSEHHFEVLHGIVIDLSVEERRLLKWADMFELCLYSSTEVDMGNSLMQVPLVNGLNWLKDKGFPTPAAKALFMEYFSE